MDLNEPGIGWYSVRCVFRHEWPHRKHSTYEERVTLWRAKSGDEAIESAEREAEDYVASLDSANCRVTYVQLAQSYWMYDELGEGCEVFSLMRDSNLKPDKYLTKFFDTGKERQRAIDDEL